MPIEPVRRGRLAERMAQHERGRQDRRERIGDAFAGDVGSGAVDRLEEPLVVRVEGAVRKVLASGVRTADIYTEGCRKVGTREMGDAVVAAL